MYFKDLNRSFAFSIQRSTSGLVVTKKSETKFCNEFAEVARKVKQTEGVSPLKRECTKTPNAQCRVIPVLS